jgi:chromosome segregation ATPase
LKMTTRTTFNGVLTDSAFVVPRTTVVSDAQNKMKEAKLRSSLNRIKTLKTFRINNEKMYQDKELEELRRKEIREPLEEALLEVDVLTGKVQRRDEIIHHLRRYISLQIATSKQLNAEEVKSRTLDFAQSEEYQQLALMDTVDDLQRTVDNHQDDLQHLRDIIHHQQEKIKHLTDELEVQEVRHKEQIRHAANDNEIYLGMVDARERKIEIYQEKKEEMEEQINDLEEVIATTKSELKSAKTKIGALESAVVELTHERDDFQRKYSHVESDYLLNKDSLIETQERLADLRQR